jgi:DNA-binding transcriptional regulator YhcF (GntR family)
VVMTEAQGPAYERLARSIREEVLSGVLAPGQRVPSEPELVERFGVSKTTVTRAIGLLKAWGLVETQIGSGTRVAASENPAVASGPDDHTDRMLRGEPIYGPDEHSEYFGLGVVTSDQNVAPDVLHTLGLPSPSRALAGEVVPVVKRPRVMFKGDTAVGVTITWFPHYLLAQHGPRGDAMIERLTTPERIPGGTSRAVAAVYGQELSDATTRVGLRPVPEEVATALSAHGLITSPGDIALRGLTARFAGEYPLEVDEWWRWRDVSF